MNYYTILGIAENADTETARRAFRALVRRYHPDAGPGSSPEKFRQIVDAYETLRDPVRRAAYDASLHTTQKRMRRVSVEPLRPDVQDAEPLFDEPLRMSFRSEPPYPRRVFFTGNIVSTVDPIEELFDRMFEVFDDDRFFRRLF